MRRSRALCGTDGGYYHHRRITHTVPCQPCCDAHALAEYDRKRRAQRKAARAADDPRSDARPRRVSA